MKISFQPRFPYLFCVSLIILVELLSFAAYFLPAWQPYLPVAAFFAAFLLSLRSLEYGLIAAAMELVIGSKGHLFSYEILGFPFSLRFALWAGIMLATAIYVWRRGIKASYLDISSRMPYKKVFAVFVVMLFIGVLQGILRNHDLGLVLADANAWIYLSLFIPALLVYDGSKEKARRLFSYFLIAVAWLCFETFFLLFVFSHNLAIMPDIYLWLRRSGIGEVTAMGGGWQRIFIQSQIYAPIAYLFILWSLLNNKTKRNISLLALSLLMTVIIVSMSRSFWLALGVTGVLLAIYSFQGRTRDYLKALGYVLASLLGAAMLMYLTIKFPYPNPATGLSAEALAQRLELSGNDAAVSSRWSQLPELRDSISRSPLIGQGFGKTITYNSQDPRVLALHPDGRYTTYAFEWAYLDIWLKIGLLGLGAYLTWLILIIAGWLKKGEDRHIRQVVAASIIFLGIVNVFTPYLNHPLGLGFLVLSTCFFPRKPL
ncbi:MAG: O-antigen ligase family protein [Bacillota bacterium]